MHANLIADATHAALLSFFVRRKRALKDGEVDWSSVGERFSEWRSALGSKRKRQKAGNWIGISIHQEAEFLIDGC
jgi:hypothetical protein